MLFWGWIGCQTIVQVLIVEGRKYPFGHLVLKKLSIAGLECELLCHSSLQSKQEGVLEKAIVHI
jgi:hypothetical protein